VLRRYVDRVDLALPDNGIDALIRIGATRPHLVMDVYMPGLDGLDVCRRLKENVATSDVMVILASARMTPELERKAKEAGAGRALRKPLDIAAILDEVGVAVRGT